MSKNIIMINTNRYRFVVKKKNGFTPCYTVKVEYTLNTLLSKYYYSIGCVKYYFIVKPLYYEHNMILNREEKVYLAYII